MSKDYIGLRYEETEALLQNIRNDAAGLQLDKTDVDVKGKSEVLQSFVDLYTSLVSSLEIYYSIIDEDLKKALIDINEIKQADRKAADSF